MADFTSNNLHKNDPRRFTTTPQTYHLYINGAHVDDIELPRAVTSNDSFEYSHNNGGIADKYKVSAITATLQGETYQRLYAIKDCGCGG